MPDPVNHPPHYSAIPAKCECGKGIECIQITEHMDFLTGNAMKYLYRHESKGNPIQDLEKAAWYIQRKIERLRKEEPPDVASADTNNHPPHEPVIKVMIAPDTELTLPTTHGKGIKHFVAAAGIPYQMGGYPLETPTAHLTDKVKEMLGVENPKSTPTSDGYVETTFTSSICGDSVIKHLP